MDTKIVRAWVDGWVLSRGAAPAMEEPWGFTIDVGLPTHVARHVLPEADEAVIRTLTETITGPGTSLKTFVPAPTLAPWIAPGWSFDHPGFLMSTPLRPSTTEVPDGYRLRTWTQGAVIRTLVVTTDGAFAARGQVAGPPTGDTGVYDQIETDPAHRRRGLASLVMRTLANAAAQAGASTGLLAATVEGQALYESLGWHTHAPVTGIVLDPGPATSGRRSASSSPR